MLTTLSALKTDLGLTTADKDTVLTDLITQVSGAIEDFCRRTFGVAEQTEPFRLRHCQEALLLSHTPVVSVSTILEDGEALDTTEYELGDASAGLLSRLDGDDNLCLWPAVKIQVTYKAGYNLPDETEDTEAEDLPAIIQRCCLDLCAQAYYDLGRDKSVRSLSIDEIGSKSYLDPDKMASAHGFPESIAARLMSYRKVSFA